MKNNFKKALSITLLCVALTMLNTILAQAKTTELYTSMLQKSNEFYDSYSPVAHKVILKKSSIVIYGTMSDNPESEPSKHTYKLAKNVKLVSRGGDNPDQKMSKKEFKKYLKIVNNSALALVLEFKNEKVVCVAVSS